MPCAYAITLLLVGCDFQSVFAAETFLNLPVGATARQVRIHARTEIENKAESLCAIGFASLVPSREQPSLLKQVEAIQLLNAISNDGLTEGKCLSLYWKVRLKAALSDKSDTVQLSQIDREHIGAPWSRLVGKLSELNLATGKEKEIEFKRLRSLMDESLQEELQLEVRLDQRRKVVDVQTSAPSTAIPTTSANNPPQPQQSGGSQQSGSVVPSRQTGNIGNSTPLQDPQRQDDDARLQLDKDGKIELVTRAIECLVNRRLKKDEIARAVDEWNHGRSIEDLASELLGGELAIDLRRELTEDEQDLALKLWLVQRQQHAAWEALNTTVVVILPDMTRSEIRKAIIKQFVMTN